MQLQSKLTMAIVTERTKNNFFACFSATTKMPSGALTLNSGLLGYSLYIYLIRTEHILFEFLVHIMVLENRSVYMLSLPEFLYLLLLLGAVVATSDPL